MTDIGCVFETCRRLANFWDIEIDLGLNSNGHPVARFQLPVAEPPKPSETPLPNENLPIPNAQERLMTLLVDDDVDLASMLQKKLSRMGYPTVVAADIQSAKIILSNQKIGVVISDLFLGQESGLDLLASVRKQFSSLKFIFITGATPEDVSPGVAKLLSAHADATLTKPVEDSLLKEVMEKLLPS